MLVRGLYPGFNGCERTEGHQNFFPLCSIRWHQGTFPLDIDRDPLSEDRHHLLILHSMLQTPNKQITPQHVQTIEGSITLLFQSIRLKRLEYHQVAVSRYFLPVYHGALKHYTSGMSGLDAVKNTITRHMLPGVLNNVEKVYLEVDSWKKANYMD